MLPSSIRRGARALSDVMLSMLPGISVSDVESTTTKFCQVGVDKPSNEPGVAHWHTSNLVTTML